MLNLSSAKEWLAVAREVIIILAVAIVVCYPPSVAWWAQRLDIASRERGASGSETNIAGARISFSHATDTVDGLTDAKKTIDELKQQVQDLMASAPSKTAEKAKQIEASAAALSSQIQSTLSSAKDVALAQDKLVQDAPGLASGSGTYGIVVSADKKDDLASYEAQSLKKQNYNDVALYDRQGFLRTVVRFSDAAAANSVLDDIRKKRPSAYVINLSKWCPKYSETRTLANVPVLKCE